MDRDDPAYEGQREYTPLFLRVYDPLILGFFTPVVWRCPTTRLVERYRRLLGHRHLDVGPGTGYFLERAGIADGSRVTLLDPNVHVLDHASRRLPRLDVTTVEADVCKPLPVHGPFDSAALSGVLHCLPGPLPRKAAAVANVAAVLAPAASCSVRPSSEPLDVTRAWLVASSRPTTGGAPSTISMTPRRVSAGSSRSPSSGSSLRRSVRWPSSRPRVPGRRCLTRRRTSAHHRHKAAR